MTLKEEEIFMKIRLFIYLIFCQVILSATTTETIALLQRKLDSLSRKSGKTSSAMKSRSFRHTLAQLEFYRRVDCDKYRKFSETGLGKSFLKKFLADHEWLEITLCQGVPCAIGGKDGNNLSLRYATAIERLAFINKKFRNASKTKQLKSLASAIAFSTIRNGNDASFTLKSFDYFYQSYMTKRLIPEFYTFNPWLVRFVVWSGASSTWLQENFCMPADKLTGAAWTVQYRLFNIFNDSIHSKTYSEPWDGVFDRFEVSTKVGGVCGSISTVGTFATNGNGAPAITMGQPGHCAFAYYKIDKQTWHRNNDVDRPSSPHHVILEHAYHGFSQLSLTTATFGPYKKYVSTAYYNWLAHAQYEKSPKSSVGLFRQTTKMHPVAYDFMNDYVTAIVNKKKVRNNEILNLAKLISVNFAPWPDQAWQLIANMRPLVDKLSGAERLALIKYFHEKMPKTGVDGHVMYTSIIKDQFQLMDGSKEQVISLIKSSYTGNKTPALMDLDAILNPKSDK